MAINNLDPFAYFARQHTRAMRQTTYARLRNGGCDPQGHDRASKRWAACAVDLAAKAFEVFELAKHPQLQVYFRDGEDGKLTCSIIDPTLPKCPSV